MTVIARDAVAADHLVYAWPFPLGPECEVNCGDDEEVVMCPAWLVGERLGPGHHRYRTPDPMRPVSAFFVLTSPVEASFDLTTMFILPSTHQPIRLRAAGSLQVRCGDPGLLIAQFVGLPFDHVNEGILRSVSRSVERMLARLLTRRVVMAGTPLAVTDPSMQASIIEELVAYNPTAGAVFGIELMRMGHLTIAFDDGSTPYVSLHQAAGPASKPTTESEPLRQRAGEIHAGDMRSGEIRSGEIGSRTREKTQPSPVVPPPIPAARAKEASLVQTMRGTKPADPAPITPRHTSVPPGASSNMVASDAATERAVNERSGPGLAAASGEIVVKPKGAPRAAGPVDIPKTTDTSEDLTPPPIKTPPPGSLKLPSLPIPAFNKPAMAAPNYDPDPVDEADEPARGSIVGIGVSPIGSTGAVAGEIPTKVPPGGRVLVPGPNGLMQSATVRQLLQGYYELEVGSSGETIWVPISGVVPE